ncbi:MAG TPA: beta-ketoacyl synthase N-terminal-like domain-containing protein [Terrimicrobiaceae bacterium]
MMTASIVGMGWVTPLGRDLEAVWKDIRENRHPDASLMENPVSKRGVPVLRVPECLVRDTATLPRLRRSSIISHLAVAAATDAAASAGMTPEKLARTALIFAASDGGVIYTRRFYADLVERGEGAGSPLLFPETVYNAPASHIAARLGLQGDVLTLVGDAATSLAAIRTGCELLAAGEADFCLVAAAQELDWVTCEAYGRWGLIRDGSNHASPFSEGAAAIVLAREASSCRVLATHPGYSCPTEKDIEGRLDAILTQLLPGLHVGLCISGGSGTRLDLAEEHCLERHLPSVQVIAPKSVLGESLACSALQQVVTAVLALRESGGGDALVIATGYNRQVAGLILTHGGSHG